MKRRTFISTAAAGTPLALTGCAAIETLPQTPPQTLPPEGLPRTPGNQVPILTGNNERRRHMTDEQLHQARLAQALLAPMELGRRIPEVVQLGPYLQMLADDLLADMRLMPQVLSDAHLLEVGRRIAHIADVIDAHEANQHTHSANAPVGPTQRPANRFLGARPFAPHVAQFRNAASLTLPPNTVSVLEMRGYCLDEDLPAPGRGDLLRLLHAAQFAHPQMQGFEQALLAHASRERISSTRVQHILWGIRGLDEFSPYTRALMHREDLQRIMEQARPGSVRLFLRLAYESQVRNGLIARFGRALGAALQGSDGFANIINNLLAGGNAADAAIEQHLARLMQADQGAAPANISPLAAFSALHPGLYAHTVGSAPLAARAAVINIAAQPFVFHPAAWTAESMRAQQRVAFSQVQSAHIRPVASSVQGFNLQEFAKAAGDELLKRSLGLPNPEQAAQTAQLLARFLHRHQLLNRRTYVRIARYAPILANAISLYEAFRPDATPAERVLSALGSIPGWGSLRYVVGNMGRFKHIVRLALDQVPALRRSVERTQLFHDLQAGGDILTEVQEALWSLTIPVMRRAVAELEPSPR